MLLSELFKRNDVEFPKWIPDEFLDEKWGGSAYSFKDGKHEWTLQDKLIRYDRNTFSRYVLTDFGEDPVLIIDSKNDLVIVG